MACQQALQDPGRRAGLALRATLFIKIKVRKQKAPLGDGSVEVSTSSLCILSNPHGSVQARSGGGPSHTHRSLQFRPQLALSVPGFGPGDCVLKPEDVGNEARVSN